MKTSFNYLFHWPFNSFFFENITLFIVIDIVRTEEFSAKILKVLGRIHSKLSKTTFLLYYRVFLKTFLK